MVMKKIDKYGNCPECNVSWKGEEIPKDIREHYNPPYYWSRIIGIEDVTQYDGVSYWMCPDCKTKWDRWTEEKVDIEVKK